MLDGATRIRVIATREASVSTRRRDSVTAVSARLDTRNWKTVTEYSCVAKVVPSTSLEYTVILLGYTTFVTTSTCALLWWSARQ